MYVLVIQEIVNVPSYLADIDAEKHPQPFILALGNKILGPSNTFVIIEKNAIPVPSLLKGVDVCYKAHFVLDCKYQHQCQGAWTFFEKCVYEQPGQKTKESAALRGLRAYLAYRNGRH